LEEVRPVKTEGFSFRGAPPNTFHLLFYALCNHRIVNHPYPPTLSLPSGSRITNTVSHPHNHVAINTPLEPLIAEYLITTILTYYRPDYICFILLFTSSPAESLRGLILDWSSISRCGSTVSPHIQLSFLHSSAGCLWSGCVRFIVCGRVHINLRSCCSVYVDNECWCEYH